MAFAIEKSAGKSAVVGEDLSGHIAQVIDRRPGEIVRCARVGNTHYRVNFWIAENTGTYDNPAMRGGQIGTTHRIGRSAFIDAIVDGSEVRIRVVPAKN
jgi:hypothetical protein